MISGQRKLFLFDIDYTLFDAKSFRLNFMEKLFVVSGYSNRDEFIRKCDAIYIKLRLLNTHIKSSVLIKELKKELQLNVSEKTLEDTLWRKENFKGWIYDEVESVLKTLKDKHITLGIFSSGDYPFQKEKITALAHLLSEEHIHIYEDKSTEIAKVLKKYQEYERFLIDDYLQILYNASQIDHNVTTIWIKRGRIAKSQSEISGFTPTYMFENLTPLLNIV